MSQVPEIVNLEIDGGNVGVARTMIENLEVDLFLIFQRKFLKTIDDDIRIIVGKIAKLDYYNYYFLYVLLEMLLIVIKPIAELFVAVLSPMTEIYKKNLYNCYTCSSFR